MESSPDFPTAKSPRSLQGPRPTPLRVRKDSHKIRKPPVAPPPQHHQHNHHHIQQQYRPPVPVIIYTVSPKVIHTNPTEFMTLVQRLTGPSASSPAGSSFTSFRDDGGAVSPAARFASVERTATMPDGRKVPQTGDVAVVEGVEISTGLEKAAGYFPGILSPGPASLPPIPASFFSPISNDQNPLSFFPDFSPVLHSARNYNYLENNNFLMQNSPSNILSPYMISPNTQNLFSSLFD